jgi:hypothetical protein
VIGQHPAAEPARMAAPGKGAELPKGEAGAKADGKPKEPEVRPGRVWASWRACGEAGAARIAFARAD